MITVVYLAAGWYLAHHVWEKQYTVSTDKEVGSLRVVRGYSGDDLIKELEKNHVTVLQDENVLIDDRFYIIGGQLFPFNNMGEWTGENAKTYGLAKKDQTNFIVTSGISDWAIKFKTGCRSEYVVIDIKGK